MMEDKIDRVVILEKNIQGDLFRCKICKINFTALQPCIMCQLRIEKEEKLGRNLTKQELYKLFEFLR